MIDEREQELVYFINNIMSYPNTSLRKKHIDFSL